MIASFKDSDPVCRASDYFAAISWGDDTYSASMITGNNPFSVVGTHMYPTAGTYKVFVFIIDNGLAISTGTTTITVT
jgi:hypothetical protein